MSKRQKKQIARKNKLKEGLFKDIRARITNSLPAIIGKSRKQ